MDKKINKLNILDFSPGIRAEYINQNFDLLRSWIEKERLRLGGWGLVEGFELSKNLSDFSITIGHGVLINEDGEEVEVAEHKLIAGAPIYKDLTEEVIVDKNGQINLQFALYSPSQNHTIYYDPPNDMDIVEEEVNIFESETGIRLTLRDIKFIDENVIIVNNELAGSKLKVKYHYANDRIDAIFLKKDGSSYIYEKGLISTSPSQEVIEDYLKNGYYLIGFAYWHIGKEIDVDFITIDRTYRPIYVDKDGNLYLNGKLYQGYKFIYFLEPEYPKENDLWYDVVNEILYIWRPDKDGNYSWKPINDLSRFVRDYGYFSEEKNPADLRTFTFEENQNLRFVPGHNQLTIIIDQVVIMRDQYEELFDESKYEESSVTGYGFKLKEPLERPAIVEVYVDHSINTKGSNIELFPHISSFIKTESIEIDDPSINKIYVDAEYEIGNHQLEAWLNGRRLILNKDYAEMTKDFIDVSIDNNGELSNVFKVLIPLEVNDILTYKVTRFMATYDNLRKVTDALNKKVDDAVANLEMTREELENVIENTSTTLDDIKIRVSTNENSIKYLDENKISEVAIKNLMPEIKEKIVKGFSTFSQNIASSQITLPGYNLNDVFSIYYVSGDKGQRFILFKDEDYTITESESGVVIELEPEWLGDEGAKIYIEALQIGVD